MQDFGPENAESSGPGQAFTRDQVMSAALEHHRAGRLADACRLYAAILATHPADADALHLSGVAADAEGRPGEAVALITRALAIRETASFRSNLGMALGHLGRHVEALQEYDRAIALRPDYPEALNNQGVAFDALRRWPEAEAAYRRAIAARPGYAEALGNLGNTLRAQGRMDEAVAAYEAALASNPAAPRAPLGHTLRKLGRKTDAEAVFRDDLAQDPDSPEALNNLAAALGEDGHEAEAAALLPRALAARPDYPEAHANMGQVLQQLGRFEEAVAACERALALRPDMAEALTNLGNALRQLDRLPESETALRRALKLRPTEVTAYNNLAITLQHMGRPQEALALLDLAAALDDDDPETRHHRAMLLLRAGRLAEGWPDYEWRFRIKQAGNSHEQFAGQVAWRGEPLEGRTILLVPEQGLGDTIQFARYARLAKERGGHVVLGVQTPLQRLFRDLPGVDQLVTVGSPLPPIHVHCPLLSLPGVLGTTAETIPATVPYLHAEPAAVARWAERLGVQRAGLRVGVVWAGNPNHVGDRQRSLPFDALAPLWRVPGVRWFSLQVGARAAEAAAVPGLDDLSGELTDFAETAAAIVNLDLVLAVDTSTAHLAGALGRPVWLLLPRTPDWRWLESGDTTRWYPTMRLFRQDERRSWAPVMARVAAEIGTLHAHPDIRARSGTTDRLILFQWGVSSYFGWGVYGLNLLLAWAARPGFRPASLQRIDPAQLDLDPLERAAIAPALRRSAQMLEGLQALAGRQVTSGHLVMHAINNGMVRGRAAHDVDVLGTPQLGVAFLDIADAAPGARDRLSAYEVIVAGSAWNRRLLEEAGAPRVELLLQGVDTSLFHPAPRRTLFPGRFVVFSGGKLEHRKGQDLVVQAFRVFAERHKDALLLTAWSSPWPEGARTLGRNPGVVPPRLGADGGFDAAGWTAENGIAGHQVHHLGAVPNRAMPRIVREADVALLPNRAEGGTNLVAMECMACGVPTILSANTGHLDLLGEDRGLPLLRQSPVAGLRDWGESDIEEILAALEAAYTGTDRARTDRATEFMAGVTWSRQMRRLGDLIEPFVA